MTSADLLVEIERLKTAIRKHREQRGDDRCWLDDLELYAALGDADELPDNRVGDKAAMLRNCERFIANRCDGGGWPTYVELEKQRDRLLVGLHDFHMALLLSTKTSRGALLVSPKLFEQCDAAWREATQYRSAIDTIGEIGLKDELRQRADEAVANMKTTLLETAKLIETHGNAREAAEAKAKRAAEALREFVDAVEREVGAKCGSEALTSAVSRARDTIMIVGHDPILLSLDGLEAAIRAEQARRSSMVQPVQPVRPEDTQG